MKKIYSLFALAITSLGFAQYSGQGTFVKVSSLNDITDGYYVITNETSQFMMTSVRPSTGVFYDKVNVTLGQNNDIINPEAKDVWHITTVDGGKLIYSEHTSKYVGWTSGNSATADATISDNNKWSIQLVAATTGSNSSPERISINNNVNSSRQLSYNSTDPRFAAYGNTNQQELQLYRLVQQAPAPTAVITGSVTDFTYVEGEGPSLSQDLTITLENLTATDNVTIEFDEEYYEVVNYSTIQFVNGANQIQVRLVAGLEEEVYDATLSVLINNEVKATLALEGEVTTALSNAKNEIEGLSIFPNPANDIVTVYSNSISTKTVQLFDMVGKKVLEVETENTFNVSHLNKGIYVMKVSEEGKVSTSKLVIK